MLPFTSLPKNSILVVDGQLFSTQFLELYPDMKTTRQECQGLKLPAQTVGAIWATFLKGKVSKLLQMNVTASTQFR